MSLEALLAPQSVAIVGASDNPDKIGGRPLRYLRDFGFTGRVLPINPARESVQGIEAFPSLDALPEAPDAVIVAVAGQAAIEAVEASARLGAKAAIVMASGFGETGESGKREETRMREVARGAGMRVVGPNSQGLANFGTGAILSFSTMFIEAPPQDGPVACVSQSGAMSVVPYGLLRERGIGVRHVHSTGNDCDVTVSELACAVLDDPDVKLLLLYLETLADPENLARAAALARERGIPIIALKSGRTEHGQRAASSHTGAIATPDRVVDAFFLKHCIWRARGTRDLVHAAELYLQGWSPQGRRLAVISNSGATCVLAADAATRAGLPLAQLSGQTEAELRSILPSFASARNPIDITAALLSNSGLFGQVLPVAGADPGVDNFLIGIPVSGKGYDFPRFADDTGAFMRSSGKPVVVAAPQPRVRAAFAAEGVPTFATEDEAIDALSQFVEHCEIMARPAPAPTKPWSRSSGGPSAFIDEHEALTVLEKHGVTAVRRQLCRTPDEAVAFLAGAPGAIVLKAVSGKLPHKSEHGLVRLGLDDEEEVAAVFRELRVVVEGKLGLEFGGILAADMVRGGRELAVGGHIDPVFGPVIMLGDGGTLVEAMPDNVLLLPSFEDDEIARAVGSLRIAPLFEGVRGGEPLSLPSLAAAVRAIHAALVRGAGNVRSIEVNPLIISAERAIAVDALIEVANTEECRA